MSNEMSENMAVIRSIERKADIIRMDAKRSNDLGLQQRASEIIALAGMLKAQQQDADDLAAAMRGYRDWPTEQELASVAQIYASAPK